MAPSSEDDEIPPASQKQVQAFLGTLKQSAEIAQELLRTTARQEERIRSLEAELRSARSRVTFLEDETGQLRDRLASGVPDPARLAQLEELMEEQDCLAQLFVMGDRLARLSSAAEGLELASEVFHNLIGARRHCIFLTDADGAPALVAPAEPKDHRGYETMVDLVRAALATGKPSRRADTPTDGLPAAFPLRLGRVTVGAMVVLELVPHAGPTLGRLQRDLLALLGERLVESMCFGALHHQANTSDLWPSVRATFPRLDGGRP